MQFDPKPCNLQAQKTMSATDPNKMIVEEIDYSHDNSTLKSSGRPETNTEKNSASFNEDSIEMSDQVNADKLTGKQKQYI